jgi:small multidrug resistance family-3 protein
MDRKERAVNETVVVYVLAALTEIAGCFSFWAWLRLGKSIVWLIPGMASLASFAYLLTLVDTSIAGRAYAAYGGVYIMASLLWLWAVDRGRPDRWDTVALLSLCSVQGSLCLGREACG